MPCPLICASIVIQTTSLHTVCPTIHIIIVSCTYLLNKTEKESQTEYACIMHLIFTYVGICVGAFSFFLWSWILPCILVFQLKDTLVSHRAGFLVTHSPNFCSPVNVLFSPFFKDSFVGINGWHSFSSSSLKISSDGLWPPWLLILKNQSLPRSPATCKAPLQGTLTLGSVAEGGCEDCSPSEASREDQSAPDYRFN